jgi:hypothetical protein
VRAVLIQSAVVRAFLIALHITEALGCGLAGVPLSVEEAALVVESAVGVLEQFIERLAAVVPGNGLVEVHQTPSIGSVSGV